MFYILDGDMGFIFGDKTMTGKTGDAVYLPKGIVHTFKNLRTTPSRMLVCAAPCGFEKFVSEAGQLCKDGNGTPPAFDQAAMGKLHAACERHGVEMKLDHKPGPPAAPRAADPEYWVLGGHVRIILTSADTGGKFSVVEGTCQPGFAVPAHLHHRQDEIFYVLEGTLEFELDGKPLAAPAGTFVHVPANTLHGFRNAGTATAKFANYHTPGGFEEFFKECGVPCTAGSKSPGPPKPEEMPRLIKIFEKHGMTVPMPKG
jgi:quercetin dioxygenase-like cupin family protein